jgi:hypothetical protein
VWNLVPGLHDGGDAGAAETRGSGNRTGAAQDSKAPTTTAAPTAPKNLLTPAAARTVAKALIPVMGTSTIEELTIYPEYALAKAPAKDDKTVYDEYQYRDGVATREGAGRTFDADNKLLDLDKVHWDVLPALQRRAEKDCNVAKPTSTYLIVKGDLFDDKPVLMLYRNDDYGSCYIEATFSGKVLRVYPRS